MPEYTVIESSYSGYCQGDVVEITAFNAYDLKRRHGVILERLVKGRYRLLGQLDKTYAEQKSLGVKLKNDRSLFELKNKIKVLELSNNQLQDELTKTKAAWDRDVKDFSEALNDKPLMACDHEMDIARSKCRGDALKEIFKEIAILKPKGASKGASVIDELNNKYFYLSSR